MRSPGRIAILLWLIFVFACGAIISRTQFTADLSAFMPRSPTPEQQLLLEQIRDGLASRLILVGIEGADAATRARLSKEVAQRLRNDALFVSVSNGEPVNADRDRNFLFDNRYLLSPAVNAERFSVAGLHEALSDSVDLLASPAGLLVKSLLPRDPGGEMVKLLGQLNGGNPPALAEGAWVSRDGARALLLMQTRASGSNTDAQQAAMAAIQRAFDAAQSVTPDANLVMTGPGVFSVTSRATIKSQVSRLSLISVALIATLLLLVYRSFTALGLGLLPVLSGALAGIAAVSLGFGSVHGITLGFGTALIGEAVDYSIYLFVQSRQDDVRQQQWIRRFWPTIRLGVLTSIFGFASLLLSGFPGLAQLGLYAITGLIAAATVTRFVLPHLLPAGFRIHDVSTIGEALAGLVRMAHSLRWLATAVIIVACFILLQNRNDIWNDKIASLSPVSQADLILDAELRASMGAPDVRYLVVVSGGDQESVLVAAEQVSAVLEGQVAKGELAGYESPSRYLPSRATQHARQMSLPGREVLTNNLSEAVNGLPVRAALFAPFINDVSAARDQSLLQRADLNKTSMAMAVDALLLKQDQHWSALLPLTAPENKGINAAHVRAALAETQLPNVVFVDMKRESDRLYSGYLNEAIQLSLGGLVAIIVLLLWVFRSPMRVLRIILPLAAAVITVTAGLSLFGQQLIILHLVGLLLVVAVGSNYALFFERLSPTQGVNEYLSGNLKADDSGLAPSTLASMVFAGLTTIAGFGLLAFSNVSILQAMGVTVAPGVVFALLYAAIFARKVDV